MKINVKTNFGYWCVQIALRAKGKELEKGTALSHLIFKSEVRFAKPAWFLLV